MGLFKRLGESTESRSKGRRASQSGRRKTQARNRAARRQGV